MTVVLQAGLAEAPISLPEHEDLVAHEAAGAVVGFSGVVRDHDGGRGVLRLEYSAHPTAEQTMVDVLNGIAASAVGAGRRCQPSDGAAGHR